MSRASCRLVVAVVLSLLLHLAPFLADRLRPAPMHRPPPATPAIRAELRPLPASPPLMLEKREAVARAPAPPKKILTKNTKSINSALHWEQEISRQFRKQQEAGLFYPAEAIARGIQGEVLVLMIIDESGQVRAARVEQSSGQPILDAAALQAVRALHSLPAAAPRETLLPVRFRLR